LSVEEIPARSGAAWRSSRRCGAGNRSHRAARASAPR
jgi:hypothetical protein